MHYMKVKSHALHGSRFKPETLIFLFVQFELSWTPNSHHAWPYQAGEGRRGPRPHGVSAPLHRYEEG